MENQKQEVWKPIPNYEGNYSISDTGIVKSLKFGKEIILKPHLNTRGYYYLQLSLNGKIKCFGVHQLVAMTFLGHNPCGYNLVVEHKNHISTDNRLENIEVITQRENANQKHLKSTSKYTGVSKYTNSDKWAAQINVNRKCKHLGLFDTEEEASLYYENALKNHLSGLPIETKKPNFGSEYKGVSRHKKNNKWESSVTINRKKHYIGTFNTELEAHNAYLQYINKKL